MRGFAFVRCCGRTVTVRVLQWVHRRAHNLCPPRKVEGPLLGADAPLVAGRAHDIIDSNRTGRRARLMLAEGCRVEEDACGNNIFCSTDNEHQICCVPAYDYLLPTSTSDK